MARKQRIAIISAMAEELDNLANDSASEVQIVNIANKEIRIGQLKTNPQREIITAVSGIGKVNMSMTTQLVIDRYQPDLLINIGVAGGLQLPAATELVIGQTLIQHDVDTTAFGDRPGQIPRLENYDFPVPEELLTQVTDFARREDINFQLGTIVSGDQFISDQTKSLWLKTEFGAVAVEMEAAALAQVAILNQVPFLVCKTISDSADEQAEANYEAQKEAAIKRYLFFLKKIITEIKLT